MDCAGRQGDAIKHIQEKVGTAFVRNAVERIPTLEKQPDVFESNMPGSKPALLPVWPCSLSEGQYLIPLSLRFLICAMG